MQELPSERIEAWTPDWAPQPREQEQGSATHKTSSGERGCKVSIYQIEMEPAGDKATFFKGPKHKFFVLSHSPWVLAKGRCCKLELPEENLGWEPLEKDVGEQLP